MRLEHLDELLGDILCAVRGTVVDNDELPVDVAVESRERSALATKSGHPPRATPVTLK